MRLRTVAALLAGSVLVHVAVSCATSTRDRDGHSIADAVADAVRDALGGDTNADAAPPVGWTSDEVVCDKSFVASSLTFYYAEKAYPGRSKEELAHAIVLDCGTAAKGTMAPGFECAARQPLVRDGALGALCNGSSAGRVQFLVPPP